MKKLFMIIFFILLILATSIQAMAADIMCQWNAAQYADGYRIYWGTSQDYMPYSVDTGQATTFTVTNLACGTEYFFEVRAYNEAGETIGTNRASAITKTCPTLPEIPEGWEVDSLVLTPVQ